jgi:hypothetical protein
VKRKEFGLAAQLAQPRPLPTTPPETPTASAAGVDAAPAAFELTAPPVDAKKHEERFESSDSLESLERSDHTEHPIRRIPKKKKPGAPPRAGGYVRRTITLAPGVSDYIDRAWRTYRTLDGKYVKGASGFIEAVLDEHRRRVK